MSVYSSRDPPPEGGYEIEETVDPPPPFNSSKHQLQETPCQKESNEIQSVESAKFVLPSDYENYTEQFFDGGVVRRSNNKIGKNVTSPGSSHQTPTINLEELRAMFQKSVVVTFDTDIGVNVKPPDEIKVVSNKFFEAITSDMSIFDCAFNELDETLQLKMINYFANRPYSNPSSFARDLLEQALVFPPMGWHLDPDCVQMNLHPEVIESINQPKKEMHQMDPSKSKIVARSQSNESSDVTTISTIKNAPKPSKRRTSDPGVKQIANSSVFQPKTSDKTKRKLDHAAESSNPTKIIATSFHSDGDDNFEGNNGNDSDTSYGSSLESDEEKEEVSINISTASNSSRSLFPNSKPVERPALPKGYVDEIKKQIEMLKKHLRAIDTPPPPTTMPETCSWFLSKFMNGLIRTFFQNSEIGLGFIPVIINLVVNKPKTSKLWERLTSLDPKKVRRVWDNVFGSMKLTDDEDDLQRFLQKITNAMTIDNRLRDGNRWSGVYYQEFSYLIRKLIIQIADSLGKQRPIHFDKNYKNWVTTHLNVDPKKFDEWFHKKLPSLRLPSEFVDPEYGKVLHDVHWDDNINYYTTYPNRINGLEDDIEHLQMNPDSHSKWRKLGAIAYFDWIEEKDNQVSTSNEEKEGVQREYNEQSPFQDSSVIQDTVDYQLHLIEQSSDGTENIYEVQTEQNIPLQESTDTHILHQNNPIPNPGGFNPYYYFEGSDTPILTLSQEIRQIFQQVQVDNHQVHSNSSVQIISIPESFFCDGELDCLSLHPDNGDRVD